MTAECAFWTPSQKNVSTSTATQNLSNACALSRHTVTWHLQGRSARFRCVQAEIFMSSPFQTEMAHRNGHCPSTCTASASKAHRVAAQAAGPDERTRADRVDVGSDMEPVHAEAHHVACRAFGLREEHCLQLCIQPPHQVKA